MDSHTIDAIKHASNTEVVRRLLIKYFLEKGFVESFDRQLYPALVQDLPLFIPPLVNKVEIVPYVEDLDLMQSKAALGWNLFVLGNQRMYLGDTFHNDLKDLARQISNGVVVIPESYSNARRQTTPRKIITFITRVLSQHDAGYIDLRPSVARSFEEPMAVRNSMMGMPQQFFTRSGYGT